MMKNKENNKNKKNPLLLAASICLILLATIGLSYTLLTSLGLIRIAPSNMNDMPIGGKGNMPGEDFEGQPEQFAGDRQGDDRHGEGTPPEDFDSQRPQEGDFPQRNLPQGDFSRNLNDIGAFGINRWLIVGLYGIALILAVVAAIFIIKGRKWGVILGIFLAIVLAGIDLMSLFNFSNWLRFAISIVKLLLVVGVIILLLLPGARKVYAKKNDIFDEDDYALYYGEDDKEGIDEDPGGDVEST